MTFGADFDALIAQFSPEPKRPIGLAVSGGSDSFALLLLADEWARKSGRLLRVFTVDHGFRPEAQAEAEIVAARSATLGHPHRTLKWQAPKRTQHAARTARYELMCEALAATGGRCLLVGHTLDDVVETAVIRRRRGVRNSSIAGPTTVSPAPVWPAGRGITLIRPLVSQTRIALRELLTQKEWNWVDDPSNNASTFERVRARKFLSRHPRLRDVSTRYVQNLQFERSSADRILGEALTRVQVKRDGVIDTQNAPISPRLLAILARCASGRAAEPRARAVIDLIAALDRPGKRQTLGGAWFQKTPDGFLIGRDPGAVTNERPANIFDGRFERSADGHLPDREAQGFLVRQASPPDKAWRELISERIEHIACCLRMSDCAPIDH